MTLGKVRRLLARAGTAVVLTPMVVLLAATPAFAHYTYVYHGSDVVTIRSDHWQVSVCDRENDGNAVYADVILEDGRRQQIFDPYNDPTKCTSNFVWSPVGDFRLCEQVSGPDSCTGWKSA